ncbi:cation:proton antiporter [Mariprofundus ferrooxydans]|uniref:Potassium efflux system protein n=1 Tax=Mariprofundus ferrooxydans PV-1 TaxID=314345 RepID=Q0EYD2_9PROT|nr:cation:proton antiporter [Mariprofundus ferrooxydans]EAU54260.1 Potassium efflux system protein [Mariprofundus ferrooxydans PV-1]KON47806.1 portal protein [Mariprofundus ferrooxydans]
MSFDAILFSALFLLVTVSITVGISKKLGVGSVLGLLIAGIIVGPYSPGPVLTDQVESLRHFAEIGVVLLLFLIGLEMRPGKLWTMRREVFGLGSLQIVFSGIVIGAYAYWSMPMSAGVAMLIGLTLALSSTAFVIQILQERGEIASRYGTASFAVLLMQDLAVIPLLAITPLFSEGGVLPDDIPVWEEVLFVAGMIAGVVAVGKYIVPYLLSRFARDRNREAFVFTVMLSVVFAVWAMEHAGLSMALGAFLMGMTLSDSRYRIQIEANIEPYKGILMSLFFVAVGMSLDLNIVMEHPWTIARHVFVIMLIKILVVFLLALTFGFSRSNAFRMSFLLSQSGEFGFVLFGAARVLGVIGDEIFAVGIAVISITMLLTPFCVKLGEMIAAKAPAGRDLIGEIPDEDNFAPVVIAGFGRVGQVVANMLELSQIPYMAYDSDHDLVLRERKKGKSVYYGDMSDPALLSAIGLGKARLVIVTVDSPLHAVRVVSHIKDIYPGLNVFARAKDVDTKHLLIKYGATWAIPEALEASLLMGSETLLAMDIDKTTVDALLDALRKDDYKLLVPEE